MAVMLMKAITSKDNGTFKRLRALGAGGREEGRALLDGMHLVQTWVSRVGAPELLAVSEGGLKQAEIAGFLASHPSVETLLFPDGLYRQISPVDSPTGILALVAIPEAASGAISGSCVVLDGVQDAGNVGSILRSAAACGIRDALLAPGCARAWSPKVLRAAMGAHCYLAIRENCDVGETLEGFTGERLATRLDVGAKSLFDLDLRGPVAWLFGNEGAGLSPAVSALASASVLIPMPGGM
ncbi:MAG: RNA methyltransferase, partial [Dehalococcoidales bacterium]|nr:RNA methyltransferase [Dehalococcoidales bacterium]